MDCLDVDLWIIALDTVAPRRLTQQEEERAERFRFEADRARYRAAHSALHSILRKYTALPFTFEIGPHGKPFLRAGPNFNLSHSGEFAAVAVCAAVDVGVDIERRRHVPEAARIARRFFTPAEFDEDFFRAWSRKEALLKAAGVGLGGTASGDYAIAEFEPAPGYSGAVAVAAPAITLHRQQFDSLPG